MKQTAMSRRTLLKQGGVALTGWALLNTLKVGTPPAVMAQAGVEVLPWLDQPAENPTGGRVTNLLEWESWMLGSPHPTTFSPSPLRHPRSDAR
ncbi:MAG: hypothetical protein R2932_45320 [Caldilineaceae bacterium]